MFADYSPRITRINTDYFVIPNTVPEKSGQAVPPYLVKLVDAFFMKLDDKLYWMIICLSNKLLLIYSFINWLRSSFSLGKSLRIICQTMSTLIPK